MKQQVTCCILAGSLLFGLTCRAQQEAQFTQYGFNRLFYNPAMPGLVQDQIQLALTHRSQWVGYENSFDAGGAPNTQLLTMSMPVSPRWAGGIHVLNDRLGPVSNTQIQLSAAYHVGVGNESRLSIGLRSGLYLQRINYNLYRPRDDNDPILIGLQGQDAQWAPDFAAGIAWQTPRLLLALSTTHLLPVELNYGIDALKNTLSRNVYAFFSYNYSIDYRWELNPMLLLRTDLNTYVIDATILATFDERYWAGAAYRLGDAMSLLLGIYLTADKQWSVGYAFDYTLQGVQGKSPTSHEFLLRYTLPFRVGTPPPKQYTPRFYF